MRKTWCLRCMGRSWLHNQLSMATFWGYTDSIDSVEVSNDIKCIAKELNGARNIIHIISGTHGSDNGLLSPVHFRKKFYNQDLSTVATLGEITTQDGNNVELMVHHFNSEQQVGPHIVAYESTGYNPPKNRKERKRFWGDFYSTEYVSTMTALNLKIKEIMIAHPPPQKNTFLLAYCNSASTGMLNICINI